MNAGKAGKLVFELIAFFLCQEPRRGDRIKKQLKLWHLKFSGSPEVFVRLATDCDDIKATLYHQIDIRLYGLAADLNTILSHVIHNIICRYRVIFVRLIIEQLP